VDFIASVRSALKAARPDVMAFVETELWPNWIVEAKRRNVRCVLINGRISERSINSYMRLRPLFSGVLRQMDAFSMISARPPSALTRAPMWSDRWRGQ
jgi:3-deoxy-D-manno-octulosonic-acid transferase